ncbi:MAG: glyoxylate/hydroxypyruvate reductase A [Rhodobacteraceae bacterium]|nr:glyoxylate/hydroxypyruvate reductase A [Paracoccaceae bacterium]
MAPRVLYAGLAADAPEWRTEMLKAAHEAGVEIDFRSAPPATAAEAAEIEYVLLTSDGPIADLSTLANAKAMFSLWAGVETLLSRPDLPASTPLIRMVEPGLTIGMTDYVLAHVMRYHIGIEETLERSRAKRWDDVYPPLSINRKVGIIGLGALGGDVAERLAFLRFDVRGWSRSLKQIPGGRGFAGMDALPEFLSETEILILLAPLTTETKGLLNAARLAMLPKGAYIINAARGPIIDEGALLAALDGHLGGATLDVFDEEPLPPDNPLWACPNVTVTPHIASVTRPETAAREILRQIRQSERGEPLENVVDVTRGY